MHDNAALVEWNLLAAVVHHSHAVASRVIGQHVSVRDALQRVSHCAERDRDTEATDANQVANQIGHSTALRNLRVGRRGHQLTPWELAEAIVVDNHEKQDKGGARSHCGVQPLVVSGARQPVDQSTVL